MSIYIICYIFLFIGIILDYFKIYGRKYYFVIMILFLFIISSFRYEVGPDYFSYKIFFENSKDILKINYQYIMNNINRSELGYLLLESFTKSFTNEYQLMIFFMNILLFFFLYKGIINYKNKNIQLFIFYCFFFLDYVTSLYRQGLAIVIIFYANKYISKPVKYILCCLLASLFHRSSLMMILIYLFLRKNYSRKTLINLLLISIFISYFNIIDYCIIYLNKYCNNMIIVKKIYHYYFIKSGGIFKQISLVSYIHKIGISVIALLYIKNNFFYVTNGVIFCACIGFIFSKVGVLAGRLSIFLMTYYLIFFSNLIYRLKGRRRIILMIFIIFLSTLYFYKELVSIHPITGNYNYIPYKIFF